MTTDSERTRVAMARMVARIWRDAAYREAVKREPRKALTDAGIRLPAGAQVRIFESSDTVRYLALPPPHTAARQPEMVARLPARQMPIPPDVRVVLVQDGPTDVSLVIPPAPAGLAGVLADEQLASLAGGGTGEPTGVTDSWHIGLGIGATATGGIGGIGSLV
jgi:hypothetical protein